jgi:hypothetical protein
MIAVIAEVSHDDEELRAARAVLRHESRERLTRGIRCSEAAAGASRLAPARQPITGGAHDEVPGTPTP